MKRRLQRRKAPEQKRSIGSSLGSCATTGKVRWPSRAEARVHVRRLRGEGDPRGQALGIFRCANGCGDWHVGHSSRGRHADG